MAAVEKPLFLHPANTPCQAHWNKYYMDKIREGKEDEPRKDFAAFIETSQEKVDSIFLSGANLEYFLSLVPKEVLESVNAKQP
jgi:hypothetical protein